MRNIVIVEPHSTGMNFIKDVIRRGFRLVVLQMKNMGDNEQSNAYYQGICNELNSIEEDFLWLHEKDSYEETLEMIRDYDPLLVLPASEFGVIIATKLANDLNLLCNPIENIDAMTLKDEMHNRLAEHNLRHIRGQVVHSVDEAIEFYESENLNEVVIKPLHGASSYSVRICLNKDEMINSLDELFNRSDVFGKANAELLVQERINGDEYIVNTLSCNGNHRITLVWKYNKVRTSDGRIIYDTCETVNELNLGEAEMIEYAFNVADALGIKYGPVHGEYMIDEDGPVLIEVNCRPAGGNMSTGFLDKISGQHETDSILDAYLKPDRFEEERKKPYRLYAHGAVKFFIVPKEIFAESSPIKDISIKLSSYYNMTLPNFFNEDKPLVKTEDVNTAGGNVYLVHEDLFELYNDIDFLRKVESMAFDLVLSEKAEEKIDVDVDKSVKETNELLAQIEKYGTVLLVSDQKIDADCVQITSDEVKDATGDYECVVINLNESITNKMQDEVINLFLDIFEKVKVGGYILIPEGTYQSLRSKRRGMEALLKASNLRIEFPPQNIKNVIIASKY